MRRILLVVALLAALPSGAAVDHSGFDAVLKAHVKSGRVDYAGLRSDARLGGYVTLLAGLKPADYASENERKALYLNAYNAFVLQGVVSHWPVTNMAKVTGFFDRDKYNLAGSSLTLNQLENDLVRKLGDSRVHAALVCGALSGPPLRGEAYLPDQVDAQLDDQARKWANNQALNRIDRQGNKLMVSMIFKWYAEDFEADGGPAGFLKKYLSSEDDRKWVGAGGYQVDYLKYDWALNTQ